MAQLEKAIAIITGASAGIGLATARRLRGLGARLVLNARRADRLQEVAEETGATAVAGDITDAAVRARLVEACGGRIDILVNNAGYGEPGPVEMVSEEDYRRQFDVNLFAVGAMIQAVLPMMRRQRAGRIINLSSVAGRFGYPLFGWYCASKHALEGLSDALRLEVAPWGIRAVLVEPGPVETEFFDVTMQRAAPYLNDASSPYEPFFRHAEAIEKEMTGRAATAEDVAAVIVRACLARRPRARYAVTAMAKTTILLTRILPRAWLDAAIRRQFRVPGRAEVG
ncbi:MAG: SDR family NAD(P)-dependent oxidoreductase [Planctomycetota bacterium]|jgi:NAD(P)-dependent dehydrogenase (short-subunit alcohol dehydrogenase family)